MLRAGIATSTLAPSRIVGTSDSGTLVTSRNRSSCDKCTTERADEASPRRIADQCAITYIEANNDAGEWRRDLGIVQQVALLGAISLCLGNCGPGCDRACARRVRLGLRLITILLRNKLRTLLHDRCQPLVHLLGITVKRLRLRGLSNLLHRIAGIGQCRVDTGVYRLRRHRCRQRACPGLVTREAATADQIEQSRPATMR